MQELPGQREGTKKYFYDGYFYHLDPRSANIGNAFICSYRFRQWQCPVTAQKHLTGEIHVNGEHGHSQTSLQEHKRFEEFKMKLRERARESCDSPGIIFKTLKIEYSDVAHLIQESSAKMHIKRERNKYQPKVPERFDDLGNLLVNYEPAQGIYQGQVVISESCSAVVFASNAVLERMNDCQEIYVDGAFKCVPKDVGAKQLLIFHMRKIDVGMASVFVLCANQTAELYKGIWNFLLDRVPGLKSNLKFIMMDFERALIKSVKETMPLVRIRGCWFYFTRTISRHWQALGLKNVSSSSVQDILSLAWLLPLLPEGHFSTAIEFYRKKAHEVEPEYQDSVNKFIDYLKNQWLRIAEIVSLWGSPTQTNNSCESFHRWLSQRLGNHPNFYVFIDKLTKVIAEIESKWQDLQHAGSASDTKCLKQFKIDYIKKHQIMLQNGRIDVDEFLMRMKTRAVKDFIQLKLYSPHNVKDLNPEDILGPDELVDLLEYPQVIEFIDHTTVESPEVMKEKKSTITQDLEVTQEPEVTHEMDELPYFVIELERFPNASYQPFIAVPSSWISPTLSQGLRVAVHLPTVDFQTMECLTKSGRGPGDDWGLYLGTQQMGNGNIEDAWKYAAFKNSKRDSDPQQEEAPTEVFKYKRINYESTSSSSSSQIEVEIENRKKGDAVNTAQLKKAIQPSTSGTPQRHKKLSVSMKYHNHRKKKLIKDLVKTFKLQDEKFNQLSEALNTLNSVYRNFSKTINAVGSLIQERLDYLENQVDDKVDDDVVNVTPKAGPSGFKKIRDSDYTRES